jgi:parvulin-like peptidyl-prolyl isomerase
MFEATTVTPEEIIHQVKLSGQMPSILESIATRKVITNTATEAKIEVTDEEMQLAADHLRLANNLRQADDTYAWMQKQGLTPEEFEDMIYFGVLSSKLAQHLFADKVEPYFVEHQLDYVQVALYEVVLEDEELAQELYFAIKEKEMSFFEVAQKYTKDKELRRNGGYLGLIHRTKLKPEISAAVFSMTPPQLLKPVLSMNGSHLLFVDEIVHPYLSTALKKQITLDFFSSWINDNLREIIVNPTRVIGDKI